MQKVTLLFLMMIVAVSATAQRKGAVTAAANTTAAAGFRFPDPQISISTEPPANDQEFYDRVKLFASRYTAEFIEQFLLMNGLRENLFNVPQILEAVNRTIEVQPIRDLKNPEIIKKMLQGQDQLSQV